MSRRLFVLAALFAALAIPALAVDVPLAAWFRTHGLPSDVVRLVTFAEVFAHGLGVVCIVLTVFVLDVANRRRVPRLLACSLGAGLLANLVKICLGRYRPGNRAFLHVWETFVGWVPWVAQGWQEIKNRDIQSFPSSHVAVAAGLAAGLTWLYPRGRWLFAWFACLAAVQRLQSSAHFTSDTLAGAALGCLVAGYCLRPRGLGERWDRWESRLALSPATDTMKGTRTP